MCRGRFSTFFPLHLYLTSNQVMTSQNVSVGSGKRCGKSVLGMMLLQHNGFRVKRRTRVRVKVRVRVNEVVKVV